MKNIAKRTALLAVVLALAACESFLDREPVSEETAETAYERASQLEAALVGAYESFQAAEYYVWDNVIFQDVRSDNHYAGGDNPEVFEADHLNVSATNSRLFTNWSNLYNAIAKANEVIDRAPGVSDPALTEERRAEIMGEAYFLRAFHYFSLVKNWGEVPLVLEPVRSADPGTVRVGKASVSAVYDQIMADCERAIERLPDAYGNDASVNKARATAGAAYALAAKAAAQRPDRDYSQVLTYVAGVEASAANYRLIEYAALFDGNNYNNAESILEVQYLGGDEGNYGPQLVLPPSISGDQWRKFVTPSQDLVEAFDAEGDEVRKNAAILFESAPWTDEYWGNEVGSSIPFAYKWKNAMGWASTDRQHLLRYGDIVLLKAEALAQTGDLSGAEAEVNRIRARAGLDPLDASATASQAALLTAILKERRLELAQEAHRWDDLVRYGVVVETMNAVDDVDLRTNQPVDYDMDESKILLPIPQQELDRNPALLD